MKTRLNEKRIENIKAQAKKDRANKAEVINRIARMICWTVADDMALATEIARQYV